VAEEAHLSIAEIAGHKSRAVRSVQFCPSRVSVLYGPYQTQRSAEPGKSADVEPGLARAVSSSFSDLP
jgi:hypothetical protein